MPEFPDTLPMLDGLITISSIDISAMGSYGGTPANSAAGRNYVAANWAHFCPFRISRVFNIQLIWVFNGGAVAGNFDLGIYGQNANLLVSTGSTAQAGINVIQAVALNYQLAPGVYYMGVASDTGAGCQMVHANLDIDRSETAGCGDMAAAFPLPANFVLARLLQSWFPVFGITDRNFV